MEGTSSRSQLPASSSRLTAGARKERRDDSDGATVRVQRENVRGMPYGVRRVQITSTPHTAFSVLYSIGVCDGPA
jgi:hypothetical protein